MRLLTALFVLLASAAAAQESYIDSVVSTSQVTATHIDAGTVSATGNVSANSFTGDGSGLTNLSDPSWYDLVGIPTPVISVSNSTNLFMAEVSATRLYSSIVSTTNISATNNLTVGGAFTIVSPNGAFNCAGGVCQMLASNNLRLRFGSSGGVTAGIGITNIATASAFHVQGGAFTVSSSSGLAQPALAVAISGNVGIGTSVPNVSLTVVGGISASSFIKVGSPTTVVSCTGNLGAIQVNNTTKCLEFCNGTSFQQVTSVGAGCT